VLVLLVVECPRLLICGFGLLLTVSRIFLLQFFSLTEIYSNRSQTIEPVCLQSVLTVMILHRVIVMTIYMLNIISDIFLGVKSLVFNFPPAPAHSKHSLGVSFCNPHICYEQIFSFFSFFIFYCPFKKIYLSVIVWNFIYPNHFFIFTFAFNGFNCAIFISNTLYPSLFKPD
jgi:type III secretory pathway component EscU